MAIEIVDFPMKNGDFPVRYVKYPEGTYHNGIRKLGFHWGYVNICHDSWTGISDWACLRKEN